eukprot:CAMPEP_0201588982 /NCGR_PEP_ID=MMETSP0190_2-20130828/161342_1 /ASSEMBLY_ACC=CAM_ASM_000263 /TAXON_ID=37353 /ORGANISM="Rosalina sp." /LENGTH=60 /DNA_ID=CAMNT_0048042199 /DNA_START=16 /DNA_END=195 /DNA_ORIENTATION=-
MGTGKEEDDEEEESEDMDDNEALEHKYGDSVILMFPPISKMHLEQDELSESDDESGTKDY